MYKLLILALFFIGCDKPQWIIDEEKADAKADTYIKATEGAYTKTYFTNKHSITFNQTGTCITFISLLTNTEITTCGTFAIRGK